MMKIAVKTLMGMFVFLFILRVEAQAVSPELVEKAKKEGVVSWYTSMNIPDSTVVIAAFKKKYPFIEVQRIRLGGGQMVQRLLAERAAGRDTFDVTNTTGFNLYVVFKKGLLAKYVSPELKYFSKDSRDPGGRWSALYVNTIGIGFNTALVPPEHRPKKWEDLLHPRWKGKIAIDDEEYSWFDMIPRIMGQEKGKNFLTALGKQQLNFRDGHTLIAQLTVAGEFPVFLCFVHQVERFKSHGAPIEWARTPFVVNMLNPVAISARSPHPNAARLLVNFLQSKETQQLLVKLGRVVLRNDVKTALPKRVRMVQQDITAADRIVEIRKAFNKTLQLSR